MFLIPESQEKTEGGIFSGEWRKLLQTGCLPGRTLMNKSTVMHSLFLGGFFLSATPP